ncbi:unnamed protein product [Adineta steineri]|uniref:Uncharacterized protein n=1 Tax=Adineta steineri TaxID=433720 RepID=A0A813QNP0_9BILA|nr:unnamed protein product [Adineta steineri]CAF0769800.1 unnamed protein product [Adineta steineri]CAF1513103.1 unnamed protein product [Adineta steineri]CAF3547587.1 unnamed protein product [Adineta steineri]CAF4168915.1 unnamed protein product [Adineta steineri]
MYCSAQSSEDFDQFIVKRACVPLGGLCESSRDCCGHDDPNFGYCLLCQAHGIFISYGRRRCGCDSTGSVPVDGKTKKIIGDRCDGHDASKTRCKTKVAPPGHRSYRGNNLVSS